MLKNISLLLMLNTAMAQVTWVGSEDHTSPESQKVYDQGGESTKNRLTECERGLDYVKKELINLKAEIEKLKMQNKNNATPAAGYR